MKKIINTPFAILTFLATIDVTLSLFGLLGFMQYELKTDLPFIWLASAAVIAALKDKAIK